MARSAKAKRDDAPSRLEESDLWVQLIREVFPDPGWPRDKPVGRHDGHPDSKYIDRQFCGKKWCEITEGQLSFSGQDPWAFSWEALAYFLPAFVINGLNSHEGPAPDLYRIIERFLRPLIPLSDFGYTRDQIQLLYALFSAYSNEEPGNENLSNLDLFAIEIMEIDDIARQSSRSSCRRYFSPQTASVLKHIYDAFDGVDKQRNSWAGTAIDDLYGALPSEPIFHDCDRYWQELIDDPEWNTFPGLGGFAFLDAEEFRYYLPAAMVRSVKQGYDADIQSHFDLHGLEGRARKFALEKWSALSEEQLTATYGFMLYMAEAQDDFNDKEDALRWRRIALEFRETVGLNI